MTTVNLCRCYVDCKMLGETGCPESNVEEQLLTLMDDRTPRAETTCSDGLCVVLTEEEKEAISDASNYLTRVADDCGNSLIGCDRQGKVEEILDNLLSRINT